MVVAVKRKRLLFAIGGPHVADEFERRRLAEFVAKAKGPKIIRRYTWHEAAFHAASQHLVDDGYFLGKAKRVIERNHVAHGTKSYAPGARACPDRIEGGRRHPAFIGAAVMLDAKSVIEIQIVAESQFTPQLLVALMRRHAGL